MSDVDRYGWPTADTVLRTERKEIERLRAEVEALRALLPLIREGLDRWRSQHAPMSIPVRKSDADMLIAAIDAALAAKEQP